MEIFHLFLRPSGSQTFEITDDPRWLSFDEITIDVDKVTTHSKEKRPLQSLIQQLHDRTAARIMRVPDQTQIAAAIGEALFSMVIGASPKISEAFDSYTRKVSIYGKIRIALHLPDSLYYLPWELLRDPRDAPGNFLSLTGSIIRYDWKIPSKDFEPIKVPFKLWFIFANPSNRPFSGDTELTASQQSDIIFEEIKPATFDRFQETLQDSSYQDSSYLTSKPQVRPLMFAFFGHGDVDGNKIGQLIFVKKGDKKGITWPWVSDPRPGWAIKDAIVACPHLRVAFLCACESAWAETATAFENSIAGHLLRSSPSLGYVIGAQTPIDRFAADILLGKIITRLPTTPLDLAVSNARVAVRGMNYLEPGQQYSGLDWWVPVLYARAAGFDLIARSDIQSGLQPPPPVSDPAALGLDATSDEPVSPAATISEVIRRLTGLLSGT